MEETDFHQQEEDRWIQDAAEELKKRALRNDFDALAIVAPPKALGVLRKILHKEVEKRIICTVNKEMSGRPDPGHRGAARRPYEAGLHHRRMRTARPLSVAEPSSSARA